MEEDYKKIILQRHRELKSISKITEAVELSGKTHMTYNRAVNGTKNVKADTLIAIMKAQSKVLELYRTKLQLL